MSERHSRRGRRADMAALRASVRPSITSTSSASKWGASRSNEVGKVFLLQRGSDGDPQTRKTATQMRLDGSETCDVFSTLAAGYFAANLSCSGG
jgi:hypothetical protein